MQDSIVVGYFGSRVSGAARAQCAGTTDICVQDSLGSIFVFRNVKTFGVGQAVPLSGIWLPGSRLTAYRVGETAPIDGTAEMACSGRVEIGVFVHAAKPPARGNNFTASMAGDVNFNASGGFDANGDYVLDGASYSWTHIDCGTVNICQCGVAQGAACCGLCPHGTCESTLTCSQSTCQCQVP